MKIFVFDDLPGLARHGAAVIAGAARAAIAERGRFCMALSGGESPWPMLSVLAEDDLPWERIHVFQADERIVPLTSPERTLAKLRVALLDRVTLPEQNIHPMPVEEHDLASATERYEMALESIAGRPPVLDLVHLGLGADGHTASLVPGDPVLTVSSSNVAISGPYQGARRMTLTFPVLNAARSILWLVIGEGKADILRRLAAGDAHIPAGRIERVRAVVLADEAAASLVPKNRRSHVSDPA